MTFFSFYSNAEYTRRINLTNSNAGVGPALDMLKETLVILFVAFSFPTNKFQLLAVVAKLVC